MQTYAEMQCAGVEPDDVTFGALIDACGRSGDWQQVSPSDPPPTPLYLASDPPLIPL